MKIIHRLFVFTIMLFVLLSPVTVKADSSGDNVDYTNVKIADDQMPIINVTDDPNHVIQKQANVFFQRLRFLVLGVVGLCCMTVTIVFICRSVSLPVNASSPQGRQKAIYGLGITIASIVMLGSLGLICSLLLNLLK